MDVAGTRRRRRRSWRPSSRRAGTTNNPRSHRTQRRQRNDSTAHSHGPNDPLDTLKHRTAKTYMHTIIQYMRLPDTSDLRPYLDSKTASIIATSMVHSKLDFCNYLFYNLPKSQIHRLQQIQNSLARAVVKTPTKFTNTTPILKSLTALPGTLSCI